MMTNLKFTPEKVDVLEDYQIFVFGSNMNGNHAGGAARLAVERFGAIEGLAEGLQGASYAIPTLSKDMLKLSLEDITKSIELLYSVALNRTDKQFIVTLIGCGIAGFSIDEISSIFKSITKPYNVVLPKEFSVFKGYKAFDKGLNCREYQYTVGKTHEIDGDIEICKRGFHYCENPLDVLDYYPLINDKGELTEFAEVESITIPETDKKKNATKALKVNAKISLSAFIKASVDFSMEWVKELSFKPKSSGDYTQNASSGDFTKNASSGDFTKNASSGDNAKNASSGLYAKIESTGKYSVNAAIGNHSLIKASLGNWIVLAEYDSVYNPICVKAGYVDGVNLIADVWYKLENGEFVKVN